MDLATSILSLISSAIAFITAILAIFAINNVTTYIKNNTINSHNQITNNYTTIAHKFDRIYSPTKWNRSNNKYLLTIPKSEHSINNPYSIMILRQNGDQWEEVMVDKSLYDDDTVKIISDLAFDVRIIIM